MEYSEGPIDLKALGARVRELRHQRGMSVVRFACILGKPSWLIDLIEHAAEAPANRLCDLLPAREIASVQEGCMRLSNATGFTEPGAWVHSYAPPVEHTFYLPVTVSADGLMDVLDLLMLFVTDDDEHAAGRQRLLQQDVASVSMLACLLHTQYARTGESRKARYCLRSFQEYLRERIEFCEQLTTP